MLGTAKGYARNKHHKKDQYAITHNITAHARWQPQIFMSGNDKTEEVELVGFGVFHMQNISRMGIQEDGGLATAFLKIVHPTGIARSSRGHS